MSRDDWRSMRSVLAVRLDNTGDVLMLGPALRALRAAMPVARITLMTSRAGAQAAPLLPWIDDVLVHRAAWQMLGEAGPPDVEEQLLLAEALREHGFDAAFIFTTAGQSPYPPAHVAYLAGIPVRVGQSSEWGGQMLTHLVRPLPDDAHQVDRNLHLLEAVGVPAEDRQLEIAVPLTARRDACRMLEDAGVGESGYLVVAPGASCAARRWPLPRFAQAAAQLRERSGLDIVVTGSVQEAPDAERLAERVGAASLAGKTSVSSLAAIVRSAALLLCNDSGPMHLAEACGTPMVVTFSGTELRSQFGPRTAPAIVLGRMTRCTPCHQSACDRHLECLDIGAEEVASAGEALLHRSGHAVARDVLREPVHA